MDREQPSETNPDAEFSAERPIRSEIIDRVLGSLRNKIRLYVVVQGLFLVAAWICAWFWIAFAIDYIPVLLGFSELSQPVRLILLLVVATGAAVILYRLVFSRAIRSLDKQSLAMLLERRFPELKDALATVVNTEPSTASQRGGNDDRNHQQMLARAMNHAESTLQRKAVSEVFNLRPLIVAGLVTLALMFGTGWFATVNGSAFSTAFRRLCLLDDDQWPRECHVQLVGVRVKHAEPIDAIPDMNATRLFRQSRVRVASTSDLSLLVRAQLPNDDIPSRRLPRTCEIIYRMAGGQKGRLPLNKVGGSRDGFQNYALDGEIFESISDEVQFYVRGDDHTIGPFTIEPVAAAAAVGTTIDCDYPAYLVDEPSSRFTARKIDYRPGMKLPTGTYAKLEVSFDTTVNEAFVLNDQGQLIGAADCQGSLCCVELGEVIDQVYLGLIVKANDVFTRSMLEFKLSAEQDKPPSITSRLDGIGTSVTPDAMIPLVAEVRDKHGLRDAWIELQTPVTDALTLPQPQPSADLQAEVDLRSLRIGGQLDADLPVDGDAEIVLTLVARDNFDLNGGENLGAGPQHPLTIVSPDKLLRILERDEADQRFRLEQIHNEMTEARSYIDRARTAQANRQDGFEPGDQVDESEAAGAASASASGVAENADLRQLFVQRAILQTQKSRQEIEGVAYSFNQIRLQLINNRIDAADRMQRLQVQVAEPLTEIAEGSIPELLNSMALADTALREIMKGPAKSAPTASDGQAAPSTDELTLQALSDMDRVLGEIQSVLDSLLKFETQNELLDLVRNLLEEQESLRKRTDALRNREAFDDIFNK